MHTRERLQFLNTARGSLTEVGYCLHAAHRLGYLDDTTFADLSLAVRRTGAALTGFIRTVRDDTT